MINGSGFSVLSFAFSVFLTMSLFPESSLASGSRVDESICRSHARAQADALTAIRSSAFGIDQCALHKYWDRSTCAAVVRDYRKLVAELTKPERFCVADGEGAWVVEFGKAPAVAGKSFRVDWAAFRVTNTGARLAVPYVGEFLPVGTSRVVEESVSSVFFARWVASMPRLAPFRWSGAAATDVAVLIDRVSATDAVLDEESNERQWPARITVGRAWRFNAGEVSSFPEFDDGTISDVRRAGNDWAIVSRAGLVQVRESNEGATGWYPLLGPEFTFVSRSAKVTLDNRAESSRRLRTSCRAMRSSCSLAHPDASAFASEVCRRIGMDDVARAGSTCEGGTVDIRLLESFLERLRGLGVRVRDK